MTTINNRWTFNLDDSDIWNEEGYDSKEEAIENGIATAKLHGVNKFYIGTISPVTSWVNAEFVIEQVQQDAYEEVGEVADDYLDYLSGEQIDELEDALNDAFKAWQEKHHLKPCFYKIENIAEVAF